MGMTGVGDSNGSKNISMDSHLHDSLELDEWEMEEKIMEEAMLALEGGDLETLERLWDTTCGFSGIFVYAKTSGVQGDSLIHAALRTRNQESIWWCVR